jgi:hypothetical protein
LDFPGKTFMENWTILRLHLPTIFVVMMLGLGACFFGCSKSAGPPANDLPPAVSEQANRAPASPVSQPGQPQLTSSSTASGKGNIDACSLLTSSEIQSIQGEPLKHAKSSSRAADGFVVSQCYFTLTTSTNSISLVVTRRAEGPGARDPKQFWKEIFPGGKDSRQAREKDRDKDTGKDTGKDRDKGREKEQGESAPAQKIEHVGDQAFWTGSPVGGALYVLKGNALIRVSTGGSAEQLTEINKSKALAQIILKHL